MKYQIKESIWRKNARERNVGIRNIIKALMLESPHIGISNEPYTEINGIGSHEVHTSHIIRPENVTLRRKQMLQ